LGEGVRGRSHSRTAARGRAGVSSTRLPFERGWRKRDPGDYDRRLCLDAEASLDFVYATQPKAWQRLVDQHGHEAKQRFVTRLATEVRRRGTLDVLRHGIECDGVSFELAYFLPASGLNPELRRLYEANVFTVVRQLAFSEQTTDTLVHRAFRARDRAEGLDHGRALRRPLARTDRRQGEGDDRHALTPSCSPLGNASSSGSCRYRGASFRVRSRRRSTSSRIGSNLVFNRSKP
jgi:hypothetical protein